MGKRIIDSPVPFVLRKIFIEKSSGELKLMGESFEKTLYFSEGNLCFARTNVLHERLGEILFKIGKINQTQFWDIHKLLSDQKDKIGTLMVKNNFISQKDLHFALIYQVRVIALSTFSLTGGEWEFAPLSPNLPDDSIFKIELPVIFFEGVQRFKSLPLFKNNFVNHSLQPKLLSNEIRGFFNSAEIDFYQELQRHSPGRAAEIAAKMDIAEESLWQKLMLFFLLNTLEFTPATVGKEIIENMDELIALYEKLKAKEMDYYDLLNLKNTATFNEIKDAYYQLAKKFHPDRFGDARDPELREKANFVFAHINKAFEVLNNEERRREYDMKGYKEMQSIIDKGSENLLEKANLFYRKAKTLYAQKKFWEAASVMEEAVRNDPGKAPYFLLLGLSQANIPTMRRTAEKNLQKVIEMEPWNAEPLAALGLLFLAEKMDKRAENFFRRALAIDPDHEVALSKIAEMTGGDKKQSMFSVFKKKK
jgi:tetratricopeptide (TPR) repeat protein